MKESMRSEEEIFDELASLTATPGFSHIIAYFCVRNNFTSYSSHMRTEDIQRLYSRSRLIRTEIATLLGLMVRSDPDYGASPPENASALAERAEFLLDELHRSMVRPWFESIRETTIASDPVNPWRSGDALREPIFYGGEAAFSFQNCDFAAEKYLGDNPWLIANKGASINDMVAVVKSIGEIQPEKMAAVARIGHLRLGDPNYLLAFIFIVADLELRLQLPREKIEASVRAFTLDRGEINPTFIALHEYNIVNGMPIIEISENKFLLFNFNSLAEALYESPFYWLGSDRTYAPTALSHRGEYTEAFALRQLTNVFGSNNVYQGVNIDQKKGKRVGEIDALVLFGDRAIVLQAKSKRLTMGSRRGNDLQIKNDFKAAVQDAYNQAMDCAEALRDKELVFTKNNGDILKIPSHISQIIPICLVADHYPALALQATQFLIRRSIDSVLDTLIIDVFTLDVMSEMMRRPLRFLSYLELRSSYGHKINIHHEITLISYYIKHNLWVDDKYDFVALEDDFVADIEIAMAARRLGLPGKHTPEGILTAIDGRKLDSIISAIEVEPSGPMIDLVLLIYHLDGKSIMGLADGIDRLLQLAQIKSSSDFTMGFVGGGLTIHANFLPRYEAEPRLSSHMALRKYSQKAEQWFGLCLSPVSGAIRFGKKVVSPWEFDNQLDILVKQMGKPQKLAQVPRHDLKLGRNDPCYCGSEKKYKRCHLAIKDK